MNHPENYISIQDPKTNEVIFYCHIYDELLENMLQIHIETPYEVYDGPIEYLSFSINKH